MTDEGGGASRSTDPAAGSSAATDVSLREYVAARLELVNAQINALKELMEAHREGDQLAVEKALEAAKELAEKHNDLIRAGEKKDETYATNVDVRRLEAWQSRMTGGLLVVATVGVANLVKLWT